MKKSDYFGEGSKLDPTKHHQYAERLPFYAEQAGVPLEYLYKRSITEFVKTPKKDMIVKYLTNYPKLSMMGCHGLILSGQHSKLMQKLGCIAGTLSRNFVDARVMTLDEVLDRIYEVGKVSYSCIIIPNFQTADCKLSPKQKNAIHGMLQDRILREKQTVLYVEQMSDLEVYYGLSMKALLDDHYMEASGDYVQSVQSKF